MKVESQTESDAPLKVHGEQEPELPHSSLDLQSWIPVDPHGAAGWQAAIADSGTDGAMVMQQIDPPSQSLLETHPIEKHAASLPHPPASDDAVGAAS